MLRRMLGCAIAAALIFASLPLEAQTQPRPPAQPAAPQAPQQAAPRQAPAPSGSLAAFYGVFSGSGVAQSEDSDYFRTAVRDTKIEIRPADANGFKLTWSTTTRGGDPANPKAKTKTTEVTFRPAANKPNVFESVQQGNPVAGGDVVWAKLNKQTLTVYSMTTGDDGSYELQKWDRTLQGTGMAMVYTRLRDGEQVRTVKARLVKDAK
jgi:hypothetical protein